MAKFLLIDDLEDNLTILNALLTDEYPSAGIITARDGATGIELAKIHNPDIILLDILMPDLDGFGVCEILKEDSITSDIPVVFVTALKENKENKIKALHVGADGFLTKPIDETELVAQVNAMFKIKEANDYKRNENVRLEQLVKKRTYKLQNEIRDRKLAETLLHENQRKLTTLIGNLPGIVYRCHYGSNWTMEYMSEGCIDVTGHKSKDFINNRVLYYNDVIHKDYREYVFENISKNIKQNRVYTLEYLIVSKNGTEKWIWEQGSGVLNNTGDTIAIEGFITDITERKRRDKYEQIMYKIAKSNNTSLEDFFQFVRLELNQLVDTSNFVIALYDENSKTLKKVIYEDEYDKFDEWSIYGTISGEVFQQNKKLHFSENEINLFIKENNFKQQGSLPKSWLGLPLIRDNKAIGVMVIQSYKHSNAFDLYVDFLELIARELSVFIEKLNLIQTLELAIIKAEESQNLYQSLFNNSTIGLYQTTPEGEILLANPTLVKMLKYDSLEDLLKRDLSDGSAIDLKKRELFKDTLSEHGRITDFESEWTTKTGEVIHVNEGARAGYNENNEVIKYDGVVEDITEKKKMIEELVRAKDKAEESERLKSAFLANMSHEIRTPMNGILGFSNLLKNPNLTDQKQQYFIRIIEKSGERMLNTINDIIDISKIDSRQMPISYQQVDISKIIDELFHFFEGECRDKGLSLIIDHSISSENTSIRTDKAKFISIITNLIKNAIKFTNHGEIVIGLIKKEGRITFNIKDTGIGIPIDRQKAIFNRFEQADIEDINALQGSGLGLSISKAYVEMLGGTIWVESELGNGSIFYFTFPFMKPKL